MIKSTKIDIDVLAQIVAQTGATVDSFETFFAKDEHHEQTLVDIGVLRFPDIDHPFFKVSKPLPRSAPHPELMLTNNNG